MYRHRKKLAIFDIDGTIFRSSLLIELMDALIRDGVFKPHIAKAYEREEERWRDRAGDYGTYIDAVVAAFRKNISGVDHGRFLRVADRVAVIQKNRVYRFTRDLAKDLKRQGYYLVAISHSPKEIVETFAGSFGFDIAYGTVFEFDPKNGKFNGNVLYQNIIFNKANVVRRILEKKRLTLKGSVGVGDTESDIPFLRLVDRPICFNPNRKLLATAQRKGWSIVIERKDVIYEIDLTR
jgi:HAD superfamily hydrolase (TIGR01490 family)